MSEALHLARRGQGRANPNPMVGTVITMGNCIIGRGFHRCCGEAHAEVVAMIDARGRVRGTTLYTNLEPCIHHGRTPPCAEAIVRAGIKRVVVGMEDPNPAVAGRGMAFLKRHGVRIDRGVLGEAAQELNRAYTKCIRRRHPFVIVKIATSLDGRIAARPRGQDGYITSVDSRRMVHALRGQVDAVLVGINTVVADDCWLTNRLAGGPNPKRIILDAGLRIPMSARVLKPDAPTILVCSTKASSRKAAHLERLGVQMLRMPARNGRFALKPLLRELNRIGVSSILVEGGGRVFSSFLKEKLYDELLFYVAPMIIGPGTGLGHDVLSTLELPRPAVTRLGEDCLYTYVHRHN